MTAKRVRHSGKFKARVALDAVKGSRTVNELASAHSVHPTQVSQWKKQLLDGVEDIFSARRQRGQAQEESEKSRLYEEIGRLKIELDWLKKNLGGC